MLLRSSPHLYATFVFCYATCAFALQQIFDFHVCPRLCCSLHSDPNHVLYISMCSCLRSSLHSNPNPISCISIIIMLFAFSFFVVLVIALVVFGICLIESSTLASTIGVECVVEVFNWLRLMAPLKLPQGFRYRLFGSTSNSIDLGEYGVGESSTQILLPRTATEDEVGGATSIALGEPLIVLSNDNEGSTILRPICLGSDYLMGRLLRPSGRRY